MGLKLLSESTYGQIPESLHQDKDDETGGRRRFLLEVDESRRMMDGGDALEAIKLTMIRQETIFRHQVLDLHRLYWTQKNTVKAFYSNRVGYNSEYIQKPFTTLTMEVGEKRSSLWHMKGSLPEEFMSRNGPTGVVGDKHHQVSHTNHNRTIIDLEADITLGTNDNNNDMLSAGRCFSHGKDRLHAKNVFDLNKTIDFMSNAEDRVVSSPNIRTPLICGEIMSESQLPALSDLTSCERTSRDSVLMVPAKLPYTDQGKCKITQSNTPFADSESLSYSKAPGFEFDLNMVQPEESSALFEDPRVLLSSASVGSSANSNGGITDESHASTHPIANILSESSGRCTRETSNTHKLETVNSLGMESSNLNEVFLPLNIENSRQGNQLSSRSHPVRNATNPIFSKFDLNTPVQLERITGFSNGFGAAQPKTSGCLSKPVYFSKNSTEDYNFQSPVTDSDLPVLLPKASAGERSEEDTLSSSTYRENKLVKSDVSAPHEKHLVRDNNVVARSNLCSEEGQAILEQYVGRTMITDACPSGIDPPEDVCDRVNMHQKSDDCSIFVRKEQTKRNIQQAPQMDHMVTEAAKTLVDIHIDDSTKPPYPCVQVNDMELEVGKNPDQPQCSSDSFELLVLAIPECMEEDCSSPAVLPTDNETTKDDTCRFKTRSGRRLRDFQKDILPSIVSLSRHEICEDLHAFTEIIKSDDSSKKGLSKALRGNWGNTMRTRRSRLCPVGQRR